MADGISLPVIDIAPFRADPHSAAAREVAVALRDACHDPGFVYVVGHGIPDTVEEDLLREARRFFTLPTAEREDLAIVKSAAFRGYTILGDERTRGANDWRDQLDYGPEQTPPADNDGPAWLRLRGPNQWPASQPGLAPAALGWMEAVEALGVDALRALAVGLGQPIGAFDGGFVPHSDVHVKIIRYPAQQAETDTGQGVGLHHDSGLVTFILQDDVGGLQVQIGDAMVEATPMPGAYIMNLGEMMQRATNGYLKATPHRVQSPPPGRERISVALFLNPRFESRFPPVELPPELASLATGGDNASADDPVHEVFGDNNLKIRLRSHPDVAARHYPDVVANRHGADVVANRHGADVVANRHGADVTG